MEHILKDKMRLKLALGGASGKSKKSISDKASLNKDRLKNFHSKDQISQLKDSANSWLPLVIVWALRVLLTFQAYMYHSKISILHLIWVIFSFVANIRVIMFVNMMVMIPLYTLEFTMIYGSRIPEVEYYTIFRTYKEEFGFEMRSPILE